MKWVYPQQSCKRVAALNNFTYMFWSDEDGRNLIMKEYSWFLETFDGYRYDIQRVDAMRLFILFHHGGFYVDMDIVCNRDISVLTQFSVILPKTFPGFSNDMLASEKGNMFVKELIDDLKSWNW